METPASSQPIPPSVPTPQRHPRGLATLFFTEMWERLSYYGMRALLVLFMVDQVRGGMGMTDEMATAIYGLYTAAVYLAALPGGWLADRVLGGQRAVWYGGIIIALGHFTMAVPGNRTFFLGLVLVVMGTGLLKPNISALVGELYPEGGARRDAGFTIYYMGINIGATIGPWVCSTLGEKIDWHYGFGAAGVGMVLGLIQFRITQKHLGQAGAKPERKLSGSERLLLMGAGIALVLVLSLAFTGFLRLNPLALAKSATTVIVTVAVVYFAYVLLFLNLSKTDKQRVGVIIILFITSALFFAGFEQAGSSFNLFADRHTIRVSQLLNYEFPTGWFQSLNPIFIVTLAPVIAALWVWLGRKNINPSVPAKFGIGLIFLALGFLVMAAAARPVAAGFKVWPTWLITTYLLHSLGELCLSPVGLSSVTKLAPKGLAGQMMGTWFLAASLGNLIAGLIAGEFTGESVTEMPGRYLEMVALPLVTGVALLLLARWIRKWMAGAH